jgi:hypothetical protein
MQLMGLIKNLWKFLTMKILLAKKTFKESFLSFLFIKLRKVVKKLVPFIVLKVFKI